MADSPLSITASITGILTFVVAIVGSVYVRYSVLRNGNDEMSTVFESVAATLEETRVLLERSPIALRDTSGPDRFTKLIEELYSAEFFIILQYYKIFDYQTKDLISIIPNLRVADNPSRAWLDVERKAQELENQPSRRKSKILRLCSKYLEVISFIPSEHLSLLWGILTIIINLGAGPRLIRWYMVREQILEKMKNREILRSRIMFHLILIVVIPTSNQNDMGSINRLENKIDELKLSIEDTKNQQHQATEELIRLVKSLKDA